MTWIKSRVGLVRDRHVRRLAADLGVTPVQVVGHLHALWHEAFEDGASGDINDWSDGEVAEAAAWTGEPSLLRDALGRHGFLVADEATERQMIADWMEIGGAVLHQRERNRVKNEHYRERQRLARDAAAESKPKRERRAVADSVDEGFERFWAAYPRRDAKAEALRAWTKLAPDADLVERILMRVGEQKSSAPWLKDDGRFIPLPATYLNGRRWEDEGAQVVAIPPKKRLAI